MRSGSASEYADNPSGSGTPATPEPRDRAGALWLCVAWTATADGGSGATGDARGLVDVAEMLRSGSDPTPQTERIARFPERMLIAATDTGAILRGQLEDLARLVLAYRQGLLVERG